VGAKEEIRGGADGRGPTDSDGGREGMQQLPLSPAGPAQKEKRGKASGPVGRETASGPKTRKRGGEIKILLFFFLKHFSKFIFKRFLKPFSI
jgi:hypothetical protein